MFCDNFKISYEQMKIFYEEKPWDECIVLSEYYNGK